MTDSSLGRQPPDMIHYIMAGHTHRFVHQQNPSCLASLRFMVLLKQFHQFAPGLSQGHLDCAAGSVAMSAAAPTGSDRCDVESIA